MIQERAQKSTISDTKGKKSVSDGSWLWTRVGHEAAVLKLLGR